MVRRRQTARSEGCGEKPAGTQYHLHPLFASRSGSQHEADLLELVHPEDPARVAAVRAHFLPEAGGEAGIADGQVLRLEPLVPQEGGDGLLRGGDQVLLVDGAVVRLLAAFANHLAECRSEGESSGERERERIRPSRKSVGVEDKFC